MKSKIDSEMGNGFYSSLNYYLTLPWDYKMIENIVKTTISNYNECMPFYMSGTGGGDRHNGSDVVWEEHEGAEFASYISNPNKRMYLNIIYMWDKQHGFPLLVTKEEIPTDIAIDDSV